jgi:hypothetical protein
MKLPSFVLSNVQEHKPEDDVPYFTATVTWSDGKVDKNRMVSRCPNCGEWLRPGSIAADEGWHFDGCD